MTDDTIAALDLAAARVQEARSRAGDNGSDLIGQLLADDTIDEDHLLAALAEVTGISAADPDEYGRIERDAFETVSAEDVRAHQMIPFRKHRHSLAVFVVEPLTQQAVDELADTYSVSISQFIWPKLRFQEAAHTLLGDDLPEWMEPFVTQTSRRVSFANDGDEADADSEVDLDLLGEGWSREQTLEFIAHCFDRDALLHALMGFAGRWLANRMILVLGYERAQPYLISGWPELSEDYRDLATLRRVKIDIPPDAVVFDPDHIGHSIAEMPEEVGLGHLFVELTLFPPDRLVVQTVRIGQRPSMAVLGEPRGDDLSSLGALEDVARAVGEQLEELVRLAKARRLPPSDQRIPPLPEVDGDEIDHSPAMPNLAGASSSMSEQDDEADKPGATAFGIPFADEARDRGPSAVQVSSPGIGERSSVSIVEPFDVDEDDDGAPADAADPEEEDVRSTLSGGFSVAEFQRRLDESSTDEQADDDSDEAVETEEAGADKSNAPMFQILRPISLKGGRKKADKPTKADKANAADPRPDAPAQEEPAPAADEPAQDTADEADDDAPLEEASVLDLPDDAIEPQPALELGGSTSSFTDDLEDIAAQLDNTNPQEAFAAAEQMASFGSAALVYIEDRFPGRLLVDRYQYTVDTLPAVNEHGPVLAAMVACGGNAVSLARSFLEHTSVEVRFYATFLVHPASVRRAHRRADLAAVRP